MLKGISILNLEKYTILTVKIISKILFIFIKNQISKKPPISNSNPCSTINIKPPPPSYLVPFPKPNQPPYPYLSKPKLNPSKIT